MVRDLFVLSYHHGDVRGLDFSHTVRKFVRILALDLLDAHYYRYGRLLYGHGGTDVQDDARHLDWVAGYVASNAQIE